jgi:hypothetical protein
MNIPIYEAEIQAGLEEAIKTSASVAFNSPVSTYIPSKEEDQESRLKAALAFDIDNTDKGQMDLFYLNSVLVSTGWNKNDDVFDVQETWIARNSPEDKQFNFMHDETDIIGHITGNFVVDSNGQKLSDSTNTGNLPEAFDIITSAVLYNSWSDPKLKERMNRIIAEIEDDKWFVSMEALFAGFDYAVITPDSQHKTVARTQESAFLTKHLRAYGGSGEYEGHKIGRLLRSITFAGKGLVSNPANPKSVILNDTNVFQSSEAYSITKSNLNLKEIKDMSDNLFEQQITELKAELADAKASREALEKEVSARKDSEFQAKVNTFETTISEKDGAINELTEGLQNSEAKVAELEASLAEKEEAIVEASSKIEAFEASQKLMARKNLLLEAGVEGDAADAAIEKFAEANDEMFAEVVTLYAKNGFPFKKDDDEEDDKKKKKKDDEANMKKGYSESDEVEAEADEQDDAEAEAATEVLEEVEEEADASLADAGDDAVQSARASASEWLETTVLRSTANLK